jgi:hypothetical protein
VFNASHNHSKQRLTVQSEQVVLFVRQAMFGIIFSRAPLLPSNMSLPLSGAA